MLLLSPKFVLSHDDDDPKQRSCVKLRAIAEHRAHAMLPQHGGPVKVTDLFEQKPR
jgi:hypothetical protein